MDTLRSGTFKRCACPDATDAQVPRALHIDGLIGGCDLGLNMSASIVGVVRIRRTCTGTIDPDVGCGGGLI